ncbi:hypothetical protein I7I53_11490 [Histoplasma capsulatum var. duboisii H88]|uniref:Uncharacterized protein n=1 Tax=Ajellomyces capsulatus (strain H88) TaxID=544711 RepID=A0A8A1LFE4_AJEC8|nr:hypothetical protein I7I53_11490 [Histoplasma capsulatum var. duboisii H88]
MWSRGLLKGAWALRLIVLYILCHRSMNLVALRVCLKVEMMDELFCISTGIRRKISNIPGLASRVSQFDGLLQPLICCQISDARHTI